MKVVKYLEDSGLLIKVITQTIENKTKEQRGLILGTFRASLSENMFAGKGVIKACNGAIEAAQDF